MLKYKSNLLWTAAIITLVAALNLQSISNAKGAGACTCPGSLEVNTADPEVSSCGPGTASAQDCQNFCNAYRGWESGTTVPANWVDCGAGFCAQPNSGNKPAVCLPPRNFNPPGIINSKLRKAKI